MSVVTHHPDDNPSVTISKLTQELLIDKPHLGLRYATQLVREQRPDLFALDHAGLNEPEPATVDPAEALNRRAYALQQTNVARSFAEGLELAARELPEHWAAYNAGLRLPAASARSHSERHVERRTSDASIEALRLVGERMAANPKLSRAEAQRQVFHDDPALFRAYDQRQPLPMTPPRPAAETMVEQALLEVQRLTAEIARLQGANGIRHYSSLTEAEKNQTPLRQKLERRVRPGEALKPGETEVQKMAADDLGGGRFAVMGA